jgi:hypothetical protein
MDFADEQQSAPVDVISPPVEPSWWRRLLG